jgi:hypothetical protein
MSISMKDNGGTWRKANNTLADGIAVKDGAVIRNINSVWVKDSVSWKQVYQTSPYINSTTEKKRDMMFLGDSITWGYSLSMTSGYPYFVQAAINAKSGYVSSGWTARALLTDDYVSDPFNGGASSPLKIVSHYNINEGNFGPWSHSPYYTTSTPSYPSGTWRYPGIQLSAVGSYIGFNVDSLHPPNYIVVIAYGSGEIVGYQEGYETPLATATLTSDPTVFVFPTNSWVGGSNTDFSIYLTSGSYANILTLHPTNSYNGYASGHINVIAAGRNSTALADYVNATNDIKKCIINTATIGGSAPIYVIAAGTVSMYDAGRATSSISTYISQLSSIYTGLSTGNNAGTVVLTIPPKPDPVFTFQASGGSVVDYNNAIVNLASSLGCQYVDLHNGPFVDNAGNIYSSMTLDNGCYVDGLHPSALGSQLLANRYITALGL